jgi:YidC/Oxa1 family membrane protein insertase
MMRVVPSVITQWKNAFKFNSLDKKSKKIVFYSEGKPSSPHLAPLIQELIDRGSDVQILMSEKTDPLANLTSSKARVTSHWIGSGSARTWVYSSLESSVFITTTPDIETMHLKRSKHGGYYIYTHHSMISMHMGYRSGAFDYFDAVFCTGPHQVTETRARESRYNLPKKRLVELGYCQLDTLRTSNKKHIADGTHNDQKAVKTVLLAPTWGENSILPICGEKVINILLESGYQVITRPHPETARKSPELIQRINEKFVSHDRFQLDLDTTSDLSMQISNLMISDWSGVAMEYAYGFEKPVLFIDLPRKVNNPAYLELDIEPIEVSVRNEIGEVVELKNIDCIPTAINNLLSTAQQQIENIRASHAIRVFNQGSSASVGAKFIEKIADEDQ